MQTLKKGMLIVLTLLALQACKKEKGKGPGTDPDTDGEDTETDTGTPFTKKPDDPALAATIGFFSETWQPKTFSVATTTNATKPTSAAATTITINMGQVISKVLPTLFGNNANPYMGQFTDVTLIDHIRMLAPHVIRAPGGSISDIYFFNMAEGQKPDDAPSQLLDDLGNAKNESYWVGKNTASWTLSIDNYYRMLQQTSSTGTIVVNYGYARYGTSADPVKAAAHLAAQWVRYDNGRTKYWEVGNENFGVWEAGYRINTANNKDGQPEILTGTLYGSHFKIFADSMRKAAADVGAEIKIGAVLVDGEPVNNPTIIKNWNAQVLGQAGNSPDFFIVHSYYTPYNSNSSPDIILPTAVNESKAITDYVKASVQTAGVTQKPIALTEWNINAVGSKQMVSNISGLHAVMVLGELIKNEYGMAARWDFANGWDNGNDHGLFNNPSGSGPGESAWNPRPAFYYMYYFQKFFGDRMVPTSGVVLVNKGTADQVINIKINNFDAGTNYYYYTLNGGTDNGSFSAQMFVNGIKPTGATGGPLNYNTIAPYKAPVSGGIKVTVPTYGAVFLVVDNK
ncbi:MAG: alpha-L-arabinofuranosidase [Sphingobacteriaceae bacterium]|nr:MAG: alpha-L-arabinofuranosidase [Sphingobacteriaceae bacterium]